MTDREPLDLEQVRARARIALTTPNSAFVRNRLDEIIWLADEVEYQASLFAVARKESSGLADRIVERDQEIDRYREALDTIADPTFPQRAWEYREIARDARRGK